MSERWLLARRAYFVRDLVRDFCTVYLGVEEQNRLFTRDGLVSYAALRDLLGEVNRKGVFWRLKDTAHHLFRQTAEHPSDDAILLWQYAGSAAPDGVTVQTPVEALLDWCIGYAFHECAKLREDAFQRQHYSSRLAQLARTPSVTDDLYDPLRELAAQTNESSARELHRILYVLRHGLFLLTRYLEEQGGNRHLATGLYGEHQFCLLDSLGNIVNKFGEYPYRDEEERGLSGIIKSQVYQGDVTIAPSGKRFLSCILCGDLVSIYEYNEATGYFQPKKNMYTTFPEYKYQGDNYFGVSRECPFTYLDAASTDDYIYLLYSGKTTQDVGLTAFYGNRIFVLNWEGEKVAELQCEQDLAALCLSPDGKTMYVIAYNPEPEVMYFRLPVL